MCGQYQFSMTDEIREIVREVGRRQPGASLKMGEVFPTNTAPILRGEGDAILPEAAIWGFPNFRSKGVLINARAETAGEKKTFRESLETRRCVIPSSGFFEWKQDETKQKFLFGLPGSDTLYMAGLYSDYQGERRFVILTTAPNNSMRDIHNRMPLVLPKEDLPRWVGGDGALAILHQEPPMLHRVAVGK